MDYKAALLEDLEKGFSKSDLEKLIGLPQNNLSAILKGNRSLSKKSKLKIDKWMASDKPDPLKVFFEPKKLAVKVKNLNNQTNKVEPKKPLGNTKSNYIVNTIPKNNVTLNSDTEPAEGTNRFFLKYGAFTHDEAKKLK